MNSIRSLPLFAPDAAGEPSVPGLVYRRDFLSAHEQRSLLARIDGQPWRSDLRRRVQHYGWRYDYRARAVDASMRLGPLPGWAAALADRLVREELVARPPDQLIVNEYVGAQGIARHVDAPGFADGIVSISLGEAWQMMFRNGDRRVALVLACGSALVLFGEARYRWTHEIPARRFEPGPPRFERGRRVSLTFRRVRA